MTDRAIGPATQAPPAQIEPKYAAGQKVAVSGIIDDGLAIGHQRFRRKNKTRVEYFWMQDGSPLPDQLPTYGREICRDDRNSSGGMIRGLDGMLQDCTVAGLVDEDMLMRGAGLIDYGSSDRRVVGRRASHGTHVMDTVCGDDPATVSNRRPIIAVQLPWTVVSRPANPHLRPDVIEAMLYILSRAESLGSKLPVAINLSYGLYAGPHDGTDPLEAKMQEIIAARRAVAPLSVTLPSGNSHLLRCHARFRLGPKSSSQRLHWRVAPDGLTVSILQIWLPHPGNVAPRVTVTVTTPGGDSSQSVTEGATSELVAGGAVIGRVRYFSAQETGTRAMIMIALAPTASNGSPPWPIAPSGAWLIDIANAGSAAIDAIDAWIERGDTPAGYPRRGRQSRFEDDLYVYRDDTGRAVEVDNASVIKREGSINAFATGAETVVLGGVRRSDLAAARYSAGGPIVPRIGGAPPPRTGNDPDAMAVTDDSPACRGIRAAGTRSGSSVMMDGTSVAAAQLTREIADWLGAGVTLNPRTVIQALAWAQESNPPPRPQAPGADRGGAGRIVLPLTIRVKRVDESPF